MSSWQGKSKGTPLGYRIFVWILKNAGLSPAYFLLRFVVFYYFLFSWKASGHIYRLYRHKLGFGTGKSLRYLYRNYYLLGQGLIDKVVMMAGIPNKFSFDFDGEENLRAIAQLKKGGILLSAHIGNWDVAGHLFTRLETPINIVMYDGEHEQIKQYLESVTGKRTMNIILIKDDLSHIYAISEAFVRNELVCMHADRFVEGNKTLSADFLGQPARFPMGPFLLAAKFKVPVSFVFAVKESKLHYHFFASPVKEYSDADKQAVMRSMLDEYVNEMENKLRAYPEQWFNYYDFWS
ncbi:MAG TPA: lipid A biosynthesis acyltransferase [Ferruginibacter sp.]|nr:lipid A biosynthesis acyltransferase [Ferruginibacter sp.]HMX79545.1 lipid A biosynthesis acyltransferase [Ferruginibacter sp.]HNA00924.1 lipid A biosynthesis acyltransferase [Ferruginibacter sp.]HNF02760.1 lipid A biosynthesis acyltransferase [Ferruginibacter sp.]HNH22073.1 lipid A biosynthesis acyltransferase [Ferruginibacter sp.]